MDALNQHKKLAMTGKCCKEKTPMKKACGGPVKKNCGGEMKKPMKKGGKC